jgi:hypothetical protein
VEFVVSLHRPNRPRLVELHRQVVDRLKAMSPPSDRPYNARPVDRSAGLREDAAYLAELQRAIEPLIEAVVDRAVTADGIRDVADAGSFPFETLDDNVLAEFERRAEELDEEAAESNYAARRASAV